MGIKTKAEIKIKRKNQKSKLWDLQQQSFGTKTHLNELSGSYLAPWFYDICPIKL